MTGMWPFLAACLAILGSQHLVVRAQLSNRLRSPLAADNPNFNILPRIGE